MEVLYRYPLPAKTVKEKPVVLIVDDDVDTRDMYAWCLESRGFCVLGAASVGHALRIVLAERPDIVVTDFTLPVEDGFVLASRLRESAINVNLPLILVSGRSFSGEASTRAAQLFDRVLLKPVLPEHLAGEIVSLILQRTAARLQAQLEAVQARLHQQKSAPAGNAIDRVLRAVRDVAGDAASEPAALLADSPARYIGVNEAACELTGRSRDELLALTVWDLTPGVSQEAGRRLWDEFVAAGTLEGSYALMTSVGHPVTARFAARANLLPDCHLSLLVPVPAVLQSQLS